MVHPHLCSPEGIPVWSVGLRFGYWPCLKGPFISIAFGKNSLDIWYGLPSYKKARHADDSSRH